MANTKIIFPLAMLADFFVILVIVFLVMYIIYIMNVVMCIRLLIVYIRITAATRHYSISNRAYPFVCTSCSNVQERN